MSYYLLVMGCYPPQTTNNKIDDRINGEDQWSTTTYRITGKFYILDDSKKIKSK